MSAPATVDAGLAAPPRGALRTWSRDLSFGAALAFRGSRTRTALTAVGIGLAFSILLFATALPTAIGRHEDRVAERSYRQTAPGDGRRGLLVLSTLTQYRGTDIGGLVLQQAGGTSVPKPPGIPRIPRPGEAYVSPALADLLSKPENAVLAGRIPGRVIGTIDRAALSGPYEMAWYAGSSALAAHAGDPSGRVSRIVSFGDARTSLQLGPLLELLVLIGTIVLLFPIAILVATAARFGSARRDRRLAALRLMGCSRASTARIAAGESLAGAIGGLILGTVLLAGARGVVERVHPLGFSLFQSDVRPSLPLAAFAAAAVLVLTVAVTVLSLRRVSIEPLAVSRRGGEPRRRLWWRPLPVLAGFALLLPLLGNAAVETSLHRVRIGAGAVLVLSGVVLLLPWLVDAIVRRSRGWSVSSQLAIRTLQPEATAASRIVSGVAVAVAGAITLQMLMISATAATTDATRVAASTASTVVQLNAPPSQRAPLDAALAKLRGVTAVHTFSMQEVEPVRQVNGRWPVLAVATCDALGELTTVTTCRDGDVFRAVTPTTISRQGAQTYVESTPVPTAGERVRIARDTMGSLRTKTWRIPAITATVQARLSQGRAMAGIYATPGAHTPNVARTQNVIALVHTDPRDPQAIERVRTAAAQFDLTASASPNVTVDEHRVVVVRRALLAGAALLLLLIGASLVVTTFEQLGERRRTLATLAAFGTPAKVLRRALWWQVAIPVSLGLTLAVALGIPLGAVLLRAQQERVAVDLTDTLALLALGGGMIVVVLAAALPLLRRMAGPSALRTE